MMNPLVPFELADRTATLLLGEILAGILEPGDFVGLSGGLGVGKTALAQAIINSLAGRECDVTSPTYTLLQSYDCAGLEVWHVDLYRLEEAEEALVLGLGGLSEESFDAIQLVEWPERLGPYLPRERLDVELTLVPQKEHARFVRFSGSPRWIKRLRAAFT
jgi:tRNA threonylcarbamoyladenosine biosynthesis protein TsaE